MAWWEPTTGSYTAVAAYRALGAPDIATSYINLVNPGTNNAAPGDAPTFDKTYGWAFNGTSDYLTTGLSPAAGWSMLVRFSNVTSNGALLGLYKYTATTGGFAIFPNVSSRVYYYGAGELWVTTAMTSGVLGIAGTDAYRNGTDDGDIPAGTFPSFNNLYIGVIYDGTTAKSGTYLTCRIQAIAIYSTTLDATQMAEISANMAALTTAWEYRQTVAGTLTSTGAVVKRTNKTLAGTLTSAGAVVKRTARALAGTLTSAGAVVKQTGKTLAGAVASAGVVTKRTGKVLAGELTSAGSVAKRTSKALAGALTSSGTLAAVYAASAQGLIDLTARARDFALSVRNRNS